MLLQYSSFGSKTEYTLTLQCHEQLWDNILFTVGQMNLANCTPAYTEFDQRYSIVQF